MEQGSKVPEPLIRAGQTDILLNLLDLKLDQRTVDIVIPRMESRQNLNGVVLSPAGV